MKYRSDFQLPADTICGHFLGMFVLGITTRRDSEMFNHSGAVNGMFRDN